MKFTVILARPDYIADSSAPVDTYTTYIENVRDHIEAAVVAQYEAAAADSLPPEDAENYHIIGVFAGHPAVY